MTKQTNNNDAARDAGQTVSGNAPRFKFSIGEQVTRFGKKVTIVARDVSPLGKAVYEIEELYKGNLEIVSVREDELEASGNAPRVVEHNLLERTRYERDILQ